MVGIPGRYGWELGYLDAWSGASDLYGSEQSEMKSTVTLPEHPAFPSLRQQTFVVILGYVECVCVCVWGGGGERERDGGERGG